MKKTTKKDRQNTLFRKMLIDGRERAGLTQTNVSLRLGVPQTYVSKIELGTRRMDVMEFIEMVEALELDPVKFLAGFIEFFNDEESMQEENINKTKSMQEHFAFIESMVEKGGPEVSEYETFRNWIDRIAHEIKTGLLNYKDLQNLRSEFGDVLSLNTLYGHTLHKPHRYEGDYELIDKIQRKCVNEDSRYEKWDRNYHSTKTAIGIRNRKDYFIATLQKYTQSNKTLNVLDINSGPARDIYEFFSTNSNNVLVDCIEAEAKAIDYASELCRDYLSGIKFYKSNAFRFKPEKKYELIWSAGLLDTSDDKRLEMLLKRLLRFLAPKGEMVLSSFGDSNHGRNEMQILGNWVFHQRSERQLIRLAESCSASYQSIDVEKDPDGINLFLHIRNQ